jgi:hypothetical protein
MAESTWSARAGRGRTLTLCTRWAAASTRAPGCSRDEYGERIKTAAYADASFPARTKGRGRRVMFTAPLTAVGYAGSLCWVTPKGPLLPGEVPDGA